MPKTTRQKDLAKIHIAKKELGLDDPTYRAVITGVMEQRGTAAGRASSARLDAKGRALLLRTLRDMGWSPQGTGEDAARWKGHYEATGEPAAASQPQCDFIAKLGFELDMLPGQEPRLKGFTKKQTGREVLPPALTKGQAHKLISGGR